MINISVNLYDKYFIFIRICAETIMHQCLVVNIEADLRYRLEYIQGVKKFHVHILTTFKALNTTLCSAI